MKRCGKVGLWLFGAVVVGLFGVAWWLDIPSWLAPSPGRIDHIYLETSTVPSGKVEAYVWLPPGYSSRKRYPVMYVLHGWPGNPNDYFQKGRIADTAEKLILSGDIQPMLIVAVSGHGPGLLGYGGWVDSWDGKWQLATLVERDLVQAIDRLYRTKPSPGDRALMGISEGGYGAVNIAMRHPGVFGLIASHSGHYVASSFRSSNRVFGTGSVGKAQRSKNSPLMYLALGGTVPRSMPVFMDTTHDDDDYRDSLAFAKLLKKRGIAYTFTVATGAHTWRAWRNRFPASLKWVSAGFE